jgi:glutathione S-transferase
MKLYQSANSVCCQKVQLVLAEKGLEPEFETLDLRAGDAMRPDYLKLNPQGVVPTLVDQGETILESTVICEYLDDAYPSPPLRPADPPERARMRRWTLLPDAKLHTACGMLTYATAITPEAAKAQIEAQTDPAHRARLQGLVTERFAYPPMAEQMKVWKAALAAMARRLADHDWLAGDSYSLAETALLPFLERLDDLQQSWMWLERPGHEGIQPWLERCRARPNYAGMRVWYDDPAWRQMKGALRERGPAARPKIEAILAA